MKNKSINSQTLRALFPKTPASFQDTVIHQLDRLKAGKEPVKMKKKLSLGLAIAIVLTVLVFAAAVAAIISPAADIFGLLYGKERKELLLKGDIATLSLTHEVGDLVVTLEDAVFDPNGEFPGLFGTGVIKPKEGTNLVLVPEDASINDIANYNPFTSEQKQVPENALTFLELAKNQQAKMLSVRCFAENAIVDGKELPTDAGMSLLTQPDGSIRFAFELAGGGMRRAESYELSMYLSWQEIAENGDLGEVQRERWQVTVKPALSETAKAEIAASTPQPEPETQAAPAPASAPKAVGSTWDLDVCMQLHPDRPVEKLKVDYYEELAGYMKDPNNPWDIGFLPLSMVNYKEMLDQGRLLPLSDDPELAQIFANIHPSVMKAFTKDGKVYAMPLDVFTEGRRWEMAKEDVWAKLGWTQDKAPRTFLEVCDLAVEYMELPLKTRRGTNFLDSANSEKYNRSLLLEMLVDLYRTEAFAKGETVNYDSPAFREGLEQLERAMKALKGKQAAPDKDNSRYPLLFDCGPTFIGKNLLNLRLGDVPAFPLRMEVLVINSHSDKQEAALDMARYLGKNMKVQFAKVLEINPTAEEFALRNINDNILWRTLNNPQDGDIKSIQAELDAGDYADYGPDSEALAQFRKDIAHNLTVIFSDGDVSEMEKGTLYSYAKENYLKKQDAEALIKNLQAVEHPAP